MRSKQALNRPSLRLGIECGGTRTVALLVDAAGRVHQRVETGPANMRLMSDGRMIRHFRALAGQMDSVSALGIGMAGVLTEADRRRVKQAAAKAWPGVPCWSGNDLETALSAAGLRADESATIVIISGTGSCAYGQNRRGTTVKVGGWGHVLGDRGSGYDIGLRALRQVMRHYDQTGQWPKLGQRILVNLLLNRPSDLVSWAQSASKTDLAGLAVIVFEASAAGDSIARLVLDDAAATLAGDALACARRLAKPGQLVRFLLTGSVLLKQRSVAREVGRRIRSGWPQAIVGPLSSEGAWGALLRADELCRLLHPPEKSRSSGKRPLERAKERAVRDAFPHIPVSIPKRNNLIPSATAQSPTERRNPRSMNLDRMSVENAVRLMIDEETLVRRALAGCQSQIARGVRLITRALRRGGRLFYVGAGTSGRLGVLDASECPPTFRTPPEMVQGIMAGGQTALWLPAEGAEDDLEAGAEVARFRGMRAGDVVVGIAASGRTPFVWGALQVAKQQGATTILLCFNPHLRFARGRKPDLVISPSVGPEVLTGSTRLKAGTATKLVLNMLTTLSMVRLGKVVGNLMVDLNPSNTKLRDRAARILVELTGTEHEECWRALERSGWVVKKALAQLRSARRGASCGA